jgi:uridine kinase
MVNMKIVSEEELDLLRKLQQEIVDDANRLERYLEGYEVYYHSGKAAFIAKQIQLRAEIIQKVLGGG